MRPKRKKIGIDLGGSKIEGIVLDSDGSEIFRKRIPTEQDLGYEALLYKIHNLYNEMVQVCQYKSHTLGIGTPGSVSKETGAMKNSNIVCMNGQNFVYDLEQLIQRKFARQNDSNCFAIAEANFGAGKNKKRVFGTILGTGIGGGYVYEGKLINGLQSIAGEWGHSIISSSGPVCYCGKIGCIENFISGRGVERRYAEASGKELSMPEIVRLYRNGDGIAEMIMLEFFNYFGKSISNLITILDPDIIVIGGGLSNISELYTQGVKKVKDYIFNDRLTTPIVRNKLGDSAGVIGAALLGI
ncbi:MAG: ROK family protein [Cytophagaceae bacterium]|jgi:fructokinase|nr:ROK family protein [Cytophagaceae bacterium]